jgi:DNA-binding transcriptional regulator YdaS (Cro superfamily)
MLTRVKTRSARHLGAIEAAVNGLLSRKTLDANDERVTDHRLTAVREFLQVARMVTLSDVARRGRDADSAFRKNLQRMLRSAGDFARAVKEFRIEVGDVDARLGDARSLSHVNTGSVDVIVTSPPYSIALDYVKNDQHALEALKVNPRVLSQSMTGVRGHGPTEKLRLYNEDMKLVFGETARVLKPGGQAAFVIGNATVNGSEVTTVDTMVEWAEARGLRLRKSIAKIVFGLYNVMNDEKILIFQRPD